MHPEKGPYAENLEKCCNYPQQTAKSALVMSSSPEKPVNSKKSCKILQNLKKNLEKSRISSDLCSRIKMPVIQRNPPHASRKLSLSAMGNEVANII